MSGLHNPLFTLEEFPAHLEKMKPKDWKPLLDLIPEIEQTKVFGEEHGFVEVEPGIFNFPSWDNSPVLSKFEELTYELRIVINFAWPEWAEGRALVHGDMSRLDTIDLQTACMLITAIIRNNRFCDGVLIESFENGSMLRIMKRIREIVMQS